LNNTYFLQQQPWLLKSCFCDRAGSISQASSLPQDLGTVAFFSDLAPEQADIEWASLCKKQSRKSFTTFPQYVESEIRCPKTYIICENDRAVPPVFQELMARMGSFDINRSKSGHTPFLTIPMDMVTAVVDVAESCS
jgi:hypothetical protein